MVRPSPALCARLRFSTKQVAKGFYRGTGTGSMGAHTQYGGYVIDWRKVRNYNVPQDLADFQLTPYVTREINPKDVDYNDPFFIRPALEDMSDSAEELEAGSKSTTDAAALQKLRERVMPVLVQWRKTHSEQFAYFVRYQYDERMNEKEAKRSLESHRDGQEATEIPGTSSFGQPKESMKLP